MADRDWDIVSSVGATALGAATMRAIEARKSEPLVRDDYAQYFVAATATEAPAFSEVLGDPDAAAQPDLALFSSYLGARTKYFDDFYLAASEAGLTQAVILASGLDVRGYRLHWAPGTTVYELDLPKVLDFKQRVLARHGVTATTATVLALPVDLRDDWPAALTAAGFDDTQPTAWLAEGLLPFLPGAAQDLMFDRIASLSAPGSRFAIEDFEASGNQATQLDDAIPEGGALRRMMTAAAGDTQPTIPASVESRNDPASWLSARGWTVEATTARDVLVQTGRAPLLGEDPLTDLMGNARYLTAVLPAS